MRTTVVPAQITTVEDRIAGNLTFAQVLLLVASLIVAGAMYMSLPPHLHLGSLKLSLICLQFVILGGLALRVRGRIVADWLVLYPRFASRPRVYLFTKNDLIGRDVVSAEQKQVAKASAPAKKIVAPVSAPSLEDQDRIGNLLDNPSLTVRFALAKKGGIDVSLTPVE